MSKAKLSPADFAQLARIAALPDDQIDTADIPEAPVENWIHARRGEFFQPRKQPVTIRLDVDVVRGSRRILLTVATRPRSTASFAAMWPRRRSGGLHKSSKSLRRPAHAQAGITMSPDAFRDWRERKAYTLDAAAQALGLSRRMVAYYEQGEKPIPKVVALATRALEAA